MTATTSSSPSAAPSQSSNSNTAARTANGSAASSRPAHGSRHAIDLFSNLLGLMGATNDTPSLLGASPTDATETLSDKTALDAFGNPLTSGSANPLADLIGWAGGPSTASAAGSAQGSNLPAQGGTQEGTATDPTLATAIAGDGQAEALQGMTLLAQPVDADAGLLAQLKSGATNLGGGSSVSSSPMPASPDSANATIQLSPEAEAAQPTSAVRAQTLVASRPANWRSTATLGPANATPSAPASNPTSTTAIQMAQSFAPQAGRDISASLPSLRTTVAQGERFSLNIATEAGAAGLAQVGGAQARSSQNDQQQSLGHGEAAFGAAQMTDIHDIDAPEQAFSLDDALMPDEQTDPNEQVGLHQLRHASVRIGEGTDEAIDIRLALEGDTVNVNFRTDNAEVRAGLQHNAGGSLADMLQRSGLQLSGVSVDAQSPHPGGQSGQPGNSGQGGGQSFAQGSNGQGSIRTARDRGNAGAVPERAPITRRSDGGPAVDVFA